MSVGREDTSPLVLSEDEEAEEGEVLFCVVAKMISVLLIPLTQYSENSADDPSDVDVDVDVDAVSLLVTTRVGELLLLLLLGGKGR
jgi:hypothetical protein